MGITASVIIAYLVFFAAAGLWLNRSNASSADWDIGGGTLGIAMLAAGIAGTRPIATGFTSWKIAKGLYLIPVLFAYSPLISGGWAERLEVFVWACPGLYALAGLLQWHLEKPINAPIAVGLAVSAGLLMWTPLPVAWHALGAAILAGVLGWQRYFGENPQANQVRSD